MPTLIRSLGLLLPIVLASSLWIWRKPDRRLATAFLLACFWNIPTLLLLQALAAYWGWWHFEAQGGLFLGIPVDLYLGWCLVWGGIPLLAFQRLSFLWTTILIFYLDGFLMPQCSPVLQLARHWWIGEGVGLFFCFLPAQCLGRWTAENRFLGARVILQALIFGGCFFGLIPAIIIESSQQIGYSLAWRSGHLWQVWEQTPIWLNGIGLQLMALLAVPGISAVQEFVERGKGTPLPFDPPQYLVTSGVYAYLANPMQTSTFLLMLGLAAWLGNGWLLLGSLMIIIYGAGLARWHEGQEMVTRFGTNWEDYRQQVRFWFPRWRPYVSNPATIFVAESCSICHPLGKWLSNRSPTALHIQPAEEAPDRLQRMRYVAHDGYIVDGLPAFARALEHLHLGWAMIGWVMRLPVISFFLQAIVDVSGGGPREIG